MYNIVLYADNEFSAITHNGTGDMADIEKPKMNKFWKLLGYWLVLSVAHMLLYF